MVTRIGRNLGGHAFSRVALIGYAFCLALTMVMSLTATTGVANASTPTSIISRWHTVFGNHLYITTDGTTPYGAAESGNAPGRQLTSQSGNTYTDPSGLCAKSPSRQCLIWNLQLDSGYCLAAVNTNLNIDIKPCSADGTAWALLIENSGDKWINREISNTAGADYVMTSDNVVGDRLTSDCIGCTSGTYQQWVPVSP